MSAIPLWGQATEPELCDHILEVLTDVSVASVAKAFKAPMIGAHRASTVLHIELLLFRAGLTPEAYPPSIKTVWRPADVADLAATPRRVPPFPIVIPMAEEDANEWARQSARRCVWTPVVSRFVARLESVTLAEVAKAISAEWGGWYPHTEDFDLIDDVMCLLGWEPYDGDPLQVAWRRRSPSTGDQELTATGDLQGMPTSDDTQFTGAEEAWDAGAAAARRGDPRAFPFAAGDASIITAWLSGFDDVIGNVLDPA